jgi:hypothetical protein
MTRGHTAHGLLYCPLMTGHARTRPVTGTLMARERPAR